MDRTRQIALINERRRLLRDIAELDRTITEIATSGAASASLSSGSGSRSYTRLNLAELRAQRAEWSRRVRNIARTLAGRPAIMHVMQGRR